MSHTGQHGDLIGRMAEPDDKLLKIRAAGRQEREAALIEVFALDRAELIGRGQNSPPDRGKALDYRERLARPPASLWWPLVGLWRLHQVVNQIIEVNVVLISGARHWGSPVGT